MNTATRVQTLDEAIYISHNANTLGMNPIILPPAMGKIFGQTDPRYDNQSKRKKTLKSNELNFALKFDLVSHPADMEGLGKYIQNEGWDGKSLQYEGASKIYSQHPEILILFSFFFFLLQTANK